jgi:NAD-dependent SIR2 family protein deacetylase
VLDDIREVAGVKGVAIVHGALTALTAARCQETDDAVTQSG